MQFGYFAQGNTADDWQSYESGLRLLNAGLADAGKAVSLLQALVLHLEYWQRVSKILHQPQRVG